MTHSSIITPPPRSFETSEFQQRLSKAQAHMAQSGMDLMLLTTEPEIRYFTGFHTRFWQSPTRPWFVLIPSSGKPIAVIPDIGVALMARSWLDDIRSWSSPDLEDDGIGLLSETIRETVGEAGVIGLTKGQESIVRMPLNDLERLQAMFPRARWDDCSPIIRSLRMVKSPAEIAKVRYICHLVSDAFEKAPEIFYTGQSVSEAFREFKKTILNFGADDVPYLVGAAGHNGYADVISPPTETAIAEGDVLMLDTGSEFDGYYSDFDRNFAFSTASEGVKDSYKILYEATEAGSAAAKSGNSCRDVFMAMQAVIGSDSGSQVGRMGHGLGMQLTEWPSLIPTDNTPLQADMIITLEPSMEIASGKMMVHEENIRITDSGAEFLSRRAPATIPII